MSASLQTSSGIFSNVTIVNGNVLPAVTCHTNETFTYTNRDYDKTVGFAIAAPINSTSWSLVVKCCSKPGQNITIEDSGKGCSARCMTDPAEPGAVYRCFKQAGLPYIACSGSPDHACSEEDPSISGPYRNPWPTPRYTEWSKIFNNTSSRPPFNGTASIAAGGPGSVAALLVVGLIATTLL